MLNIVLGDRLHQKVISSIRLGYWPQIRNPRTFNEKLLHRKVYTNDTRFSLVEDKWNARNIVESTIGDEYLPAIIQVTNDPDTLRFNEFPDAYVIKPTHMSGEYIIVDAKEEIDTNDLVDLCHSWLATQYGVAKGEYWYRYITPRIIVEERLTDDRLYVPADFKFYVFTVASNSSV